MAVKRLHTLRFKKSKGQGVIEITGSLIIFVIMICLMMTISMFLYVQHAAVSAVREGTRFAALNPEIGQASTQQAGITQVQNYVITTVQQLSGMNITANQITVTPPDPTAPQGQRSVRVNIQFNMQNPIPIGDFVAAFGAQNTDSLNNIPISAFAIMHYEE